MLNCSMYLGLPLDDLLGHGDPGEGMDGLLLHAALKLLHIRKGHVRLRPSADIAKKRR